MNPAASGGGTAGARVLARRQVHPRPRPRSAQRLAVLVVDRTDHVRELINTIGDQLDLQAAHDPADALFLVGRTCPDVVLLARADGRLSAASALEVLRAREPALPIVVGVGLSDGDWAARAAALDPAAVIAHPFRPGPLVRLLQSLAPPHVDFEARPLPLDFGCLRIASVAPEIWLGGVRRTLPLREFLLLRFLAERAGTVVSRVEIGEAVWGSAAAGRTNTLTVHIMRLRRRLGDGDPCWITAVRGVGYRFDAPNTD